MKDIKHATRRSRVLIQLAWTQTVGWGPSQHTADYEISYVTFKALCSVFLVSFNIISYKALPLYEYQRQYQELIAET